MRERLPHGIVLALTLGLFFPWISGALPHLRLERSSPADEAVLDESPGEIRLWFSQEPELAVSRIELRGPAGAVELGEVDSGEEDLKVLFATVPGPLPAGDFTVSWVTSSGDGHPVKGDFSFRVAAAGSTR